MRCVTDEIVPHKIATMLALRCAIDQGMLKAEGLREEDRTLFERFVAIPTEMLEVIHPIGFSLTRSFEQVELRYGIRFDMVKIAELKTAKIEGRIFQSS